MIGINPFRSSQKQEEINHFIQNTQLPPFCLTSPSSLSALAKLEKITFQWINDGVCIHVKLSMMEQLTSTN